MQKEFIPYKLALKMKKLGFDEPCFAWFFKSEPSKVQMSYCHNSCDWLLGDNCSAPTWQSAFDWVIPQINDEFKVCLGENGWYIYNLENQVYEKDKALEKLIEIVENKK